MKKEKLEKLVKMKKCKKKKKNKQIFTIFLPILYFKKNVDNISFSFQFGIFPDNLTK